MRLEARAGTMYDGGDHKRDLYIGPGNGRFSLFQPITAPHTGLEL